MTTFRDTLTPAAASSVEYDTKARTLTLELAPGRRQAVDFPLRPGTFEHLGHDELREVALFLKLKGRRSVETLRRYTAEMEKFLVFLQVRGHRALDEWVLIDYQDNLIAPCPELAAEGRVTFNPMKPETVDQYMNVVRSFVQQLASKNLLGYNTAKQVPSLGIREEKALGPPPCFTDEQWRAVLETLEAMPRRTPGERSRAERLRFCIRFGYALALRVNEMARHHHGHLVLRDEQWSLKVMGKGLRARSLSLTGADDLAWVALSRYRSFLKLPLESAGEPIPLLPRHSAVRVRTRGARKGVEIDARSLSTSTWQHTFKAFLRDEVLTHLYGDRETVKAEVYAHEWEQLTPHSLRHTRITHLVQAGKDLFWIQRFAGHENLNTTRRYFHGEV